MHNYATRVLQLFIIIINYTEYKLPSRVKTFLNNFFSIKFFLHLVF